MTEQTREELQAQIDELNKKLQALESGRSAVAQEGGVAAGPGGVAVGGDIRGNVYMGSGPGDDVEALLIYRRVIASGYRQLPLRGVDVGASDPASGQKRLDLDQVYVALETKTQVHTDSNEKRRRRERLPFEPGEIRPLSALQATAGNSRLVLLGDPGSGKSTFLNHLGLCLALQGMEPQGRWLERLPDWPAAEAELFPIPVVLRDFSRHLPEGQIKPEPHHLWDFVVSRLKAQNMTFAGKPLLRALEKGKAVVLLDGLDEIPEKTKLTAVRNAVAVFAKRYSRTRMVVTCRTLSYQDLAWRLEDFPDFELAPFDEGKIDAFIDAWYLELERLGIVKAEAAKGLTSRLKEAVRRPDLWRLAPNPLLLTVMALVHTHKGHLPDARALLYEDVMDILLWRWEQIKLGDEGDTPRLRELLLSAERTDVDLKGVLWQLAFEAHREGEVADGELLADISEFRLEKALARLHPDESRDWAHGLIEAMKLRAGLLLERAPEIYTFPHRTFQEYVAGAHLAAQADFAQKAAQLVAEGDLWRQVILLAVGRLVYLGGDTDKPLALVGELCPHEPEEEELSWRKAWLAGEILNEIGLNRVKDRGLGRDLLERVRGRLVKLLDAGALGSVERAAAGDTLARLVDPRFQADAWYLADKPMLDFVEIPSGSFFMGSNKERDPEAYDDELPQHEVTLPTYYIARYPVTVAQFRAFVHDSGYEPRDSDCLKGLDNHPVVDVTWYDATAYCDWLTERLRAWENTPEPVATLLRQGKGGGSPWRATLPSEAQWEKAARGSDGRVYPWGDGADPNRANFDDTGIGVTSAVGIFPAGASPCGCMDMAGNVWEWTRSLWGKKFEEPNFKYPYDPKDGREDLNAGNDVARVLRGGSFRDAEDYVRCGSRGGRGLPVVTDGHVGFRVVLSPVTSGL